MTFLGDAMNSRPIDPDIAQAMCALIYDHINYDIDIRKVLGLVKRRGNTHEPDPDKAAAAIERWAKGLSKKDAITEMNKLIPTATKKTAKDRFVKLARHRAQQEALKMYLDKLAEDQ